MKLLEIVLIVVLLVIVVNFTRENKYKPHKSYKSNRDKDNIISVSEENILIENRGDPVKTTGNFPIPQSSTISKSLSTDYPEDLSIITNGATIDNQDIIVEERSSITPMNESHFPKYYRKDNMSGNTIGSSEYKFAEVDNLKSSHAWSDQNVSQYPNFYTSQIKNGLTNPGDFFDVNNNFVDTTKPRSTANVGDICFMSKEGENVCLDNSRVQNVPPSLISDVSNCGFLNSIGLLEFSNLINEDKERVNNGGFLYGNVKGSKKHNEVYSEPIQQQVLSCQV
tara:strand:+ start:457 stop:1299 length:843 start_codon:yes stop_codon:yes gene_type:complete